MLIPILHISANYNRADWAATFDSSEHNNVFLACSDTDAFAARFVFFTNETMIYIGTDARLDDTVYGFVYG